MPRTASKPRPEPAKAPKPRRRPSTNGPQRLLHDLSNALGSAGMRLHLVLDLIGPGEANQHVAAAETSVARAVALLGRMRKLVDGGSKRVGGKRRSPGARRNGRANGRAAGA